MQLRATSPPLPPGHGVLLPGRLRSVVARRTPHRMAPRRFHEARSRGIARRPLFLLFAPACAQQGDPRLRAHTSRPDVPVATPVERGASGDADLRVMLAELASAKACEMIRGQFRPLRAPDRADVVTGLMWIRECKVTNVGTSVSLSLAGDGWQWADQQQHKAGGSFSVHPVREVRDDGRAEGGARRCV